MATIAVVGLGYVGLPLVVAFGRLGRTSGFDISEARVNTCERGSDPSRELTDAAMRSAVHAIYNSDASMLAEADVIRGRADPRRYRAHTGPWTAGGEHTLQKIVKVVAGDTPRTLDRVAALYESIVEPGVHRAPSIVVPSQRR